MRALALVTHTPDCENKWQSFECLGNEVTVERYDDRPHDRHGELVELAKRLRPDVIIYIGAIEKYHLHPVPRPDVLKRLRDVAPMVHICGDASDVPWWEWLDLYEREGCFSVQVSIDGSPATPVAQYGLVLLTPVDVRAFRPKLWNDRSIKCSTVGGKGHTRRADLINALQSAGQLTLVGTGNSYAQMGAAMCDSKFTFNAPFNGTGTGMHVKGRVVEAGFARSCLLELRGSPTQRWFTPGADYVEYDNADEACFYLEQLEANSVHYMKIASSLHARCHREHHPAVFWKRVLHCAGVPPSLWDSQGA